jgi:hypothetical protein
MYFRYARHTNDLNNLSSFYKEIFEFQILGVFNNHDGYNGVFIGKPTLDWHLEFTTSEEIVQHNFSEDDCLVFYPQTEEEYAKILHNIENNKVKTIQHKNPYWNENGITFRDPDGFYIVISPLRITTE